MPESCQRRKNMALNWESVFTGIVSLIVIGAFHPLVIWCEYHFTEKVWPAFLTAGVLCMAAALFTEGMVSTIFGLFGAGLLWSIRELKQQTERVKKGWFPKNPKRN